MKCLLSPSTQTRTRQPGHGAGNDRRPDYGGPDACKMYPWEDNAQIADLGVLTLEPFRGKGHARKVVRSICKYAYDQGYDPQYRCQLDNHASTPLAKAAGLTLFGKWDVISPDSK